MTRPQAPIVTRVLGGLGNQMFQYAAARVLADRNGRGLALDLSGFKNYGLRPFALGALRIRAKAADPAALEAWGVATAPWRRRLRALFPGLVPMPEGGMPAVNEAGFAWQALPEPGLQGLYLDGYWQSWRYLQGGEARLRKDFQPKAAPAGANAELLRRIRRQGAVALHVRRGDYANNWITRSVYTLLEQDYYQAALAWLKPAPRELVLVFSDEPDWVSANWRLHPRQELVRHNSPSRPEEDLRLMAACRKLVIANSSLSWWAAWLAGPRARVAAPRRWFRSSARPTADLCPPRWRRL